MSVLYIIDINLVVSLCTDYTPGGELEVESLWWWDRELAWNMERQGWRTCGGPQQLSTLYKRYLCSEAPLSSTSIIAQHDNLRVVNARVWVCDPELASRGLREITGEPLNSHSRILAPNRCEITGVDCTYT